MTKAKGRQNNNGAQIIAMVYSTWALKQVNLALAQRERVAERCPHEIS